MSTKKPLSKYRQNPHDSRGSYYYPSELKNPDNDFVGDTLYDQARDYEEQRLFYSDPTAWTLENYADEIKVRVRITQNEIFIIGEILCLAKKKCSEENISFQQWINDNFDFSYETANNFMNVFKNCFGLKAIVYKIPASILYMISKPSFPEELKQYLGENLYQKGQLDTMSISGLKKLTDLYKSEGMEAVEKEIPKVTQRVSALRQSQCALDETTNAVRTLEGFMTKISNRVGHRVDLIGCCEDTDYDNIGLLITKKLYSAIEDAVAIIDKALRESKDIYSDSLKEEI